MPFLIYCPTCRQGLTVHESQAGAAVACPQCRCMLTVPAEPPPLIEPVRDDRPTLDRRRRYERASPVRPLTVFLVLVGLLVAAAAGIYVYTQNQPAGDEVRSRVEKTVQPAPTPPPKRDLPKPPPAVVTPRPPQKEEPPPPPKPPTFDEAYEQAKTISDELNQDEPEKTAKALKLLTGAERLQVQPFLTSPDEALQSPGAATALNRNGLRDRASAMSRRLAVKDDAFKPVAAKLWVPSTGPAGIVRMMEEWGQIPAGWQQFVAHAVKNETPTVQLNPEVRNAILQLGGRAWLER